MSKQIFIVSGLLVAVVLLGGWNFALNQKLASGQKTSLVAFYANDAFAGMTPEQRANPDQAYAILSARLSPLGQGVQFGPNTASAKKSKGECRRMLDNMNQEYKSFLLAPGGWEIAEAHYKNWEAQSKVFFANCF